MATGGDDQQRNPDREESFWFRSQSMAAQCSTSKGWCGRIACVLSHKFLYCKDFQNTGECSNGRCLGLHVRKVDMLHHSMTGVMTSGFLLEVLRSRQLETICFDHLRRTCARGERCKRVHIDRDDVPYFQCCVCDPQPDGVPIKNGELIQLTCNHYLCEACWHGILGSSSGAPTCPLCRQMVQGILYLPS